jgi:hypothetical protein
MTHKQELGTELALLEDSSRLPTYAGVVGLNILCGSVSKKSGFHLDLTPRVRQEVPEDKGKQANGKKATPKSQQYKWSKY